MLLASRISNDENLLSDLSFVDDDDDDDDDKR